MRGRELGGSWGERKERRECSGQMGKACATALTGGNRYAWGRASTAEAREQGQCAKDGSRAKPTEPYRPLRIRDYSEKQ